MELLEKVKEEKQQFNSDKWLEQCRIFNGTSPFNWFWKTKSCENEPRFNCVYSRNNLPKIKDEAYVISRWV